jgi:palmitoyltransferase
LTVNVQDWPYLLPQSAFVLIYLLAIVLCIAVALMLSFHIWGIVVGETSVESHDFPMYRERAKSRGNTFVNCYDLGYAVSPHSTDIILIPDSGNDKT